MLAGKQGGRFAASQSTSESLLPASGVAGMLLGQAEAEQKATMSLKVGSVVVSPSSRTFLVVLDESELRLVIISPSPSCRHPCPKHARKGILRNSLESCCVFVRACTPAAGHGMCSAAQEAGGERNVN